MSNLSKICKSIGYAIIVLGIIASLSTAINSARPLGSFGEFHFGIFLLVLIIGGLVSVASSIIMFVISEVLERLAMIEYDLHSIANSKSMSSANEAARKGEILNSGGWTCNQCGKTNPGYVGTCACGADKPRN